jgi:hypothetical protein
MQRTISNKTTNHYNSHYNYFLKVKSRMYKFINKPCSWLLKFLNFKKIVVGFLFVYKIVHLLQCI